MKGDLISREALKEAIKQKSCYAEYYPTSRMLEEIDNAPTVEPKQNIAVIPPELIKELAETVVGIINDIDWKTAIEKYNERPKGEWISNHSEFSFMNCGRSCSICGKTVEFSENYCPNCGADMREGDGS